MLLCGRDESPGERIVIAYGPRRRVCTELRYRLSHRECAGLHHRQTERNADRERQLPHRTPQGSTAIKAEYASPKAAQMNGNHGRAQPLNDLFKPSMKLPDIAAERQRSFREDTHQVSLFKFFARELNCFHNAAAISTWYADGVKQREHAGVAVVPFLGNHEPHQTAYASADEKAVYEGNVIGNQQRRAAARHIFLTQGSDLVNK